jgi:hypothetical protein
MSKKDKMPEASEFDSLVETIKKHHSKSMYRSVIDAVIAVINARDEGAENAVSTLIEHKKLKPHADLIKKIAGVPSSEEDEEEEVANAHLQPS